MRMRGLAAMCALGALLCLATLSTAQTARRPKPTASPTPSFRPQAVVTMADGTAVELADFSFYDGYTSFGGGFYIRCSVADAEPGVFLLKQGSFLRGIPARDIQELHLSAPQGDWMDARLLPVGGVESPARLPLKPSDTWVKGETFQVVGERNVLGTKGEFRMAVEDVRTIERRPELRMFNVTDKAGTILQVSDLKLGRAYTCPIGERSRRDLESGRLPLVADKTRVEVPLKDIARLVFPETAKGPLTVGMRKGEGAAAELRDVECAFGKTASGQVWFVDLRDGDRYVVRSIEFR